MRTWVIALGIALVSTSFALAGKQLPFYVENGSREQTLRLKHVLHLGIQQENLFRRLDLDEKDSFVVDYLSEDEEVKNFDILSIEQTSGNLKAVKKPFVRPTTKSQQWGKLTVPKAVKWDEEEIWVPDMEDKETVLTLAKMTYNTYLAPKTSSWYDLGERWQTNSSFGWEKDGLRGHVFGNEDNSTLVIAFKGTTAAFLWMGDGETSTQDKLNDNLLFSCCCGRVDPTWTPVCGCFTGSNTCNQTCVEESLSGRSLYYQAAMVRFSSFTLSFSHTK
ncbi:putative lipase atg15 [Basidiobolus ranarum]|uniref:triacylglycerol lipase n=1 Tax=Basidiobolus ranarum TaxID=34480 RepID=A0ABR2WL36_9FUNG